MTATPPASRASRSPAADDGRQRMDIVIVGHVDHGKSTLVGRLMADTGSLPQGKLDEVRARCLRNSRPFEYAFLLDALKDEQAQGITIDSARCFFKSALRDYILIDAPGHVEFLRNMVSGAARAEAGLLVIDAKEGVRENSRRHGYLMSMLGIAQVAVCINKMDLAHYDRAVYEGIVAEYSAFLARVGLRPAGFVPISAREGDNVAARSERMRWYEGPTVLQRLDAFAKEPGRSDRPLRMPVQDIYKFTERGDDRRIVAGRIETGAVAVGDEVVFLPSGKRSRIAGVEGFPSSPGRTAGAGQSVGLTLQTQVYVRPGELMCKSGQPSPQVSRRLRANLFWLGRAPMVRGKRYKMKLAGARVPVYLAEVLSVMDAADLSAHAGRAQVERHDVAQVVLESVRPVACDLAADIAQTGRFVLIDDYETAGGGIILEAQEDGQGLLQRQVRQRNAAWERSEIPPAQREARYRQRPALVLLCGPAGTGKGRLAKRFERELFESGHAVYYLGLSNALLEGRATPDTFGQREESLVRLGEAAHVFTDAGTILIATVSDLDDGELDIVRTLTEPGEVVVVAVGDAALVRSNPDLQLAVGEDPAGAVRRIRRMLRERRYLPEYYL